MDFSHVPADVRWAYANVPRNTISVWSNSEEIMAREFIGNIAAVNLFPSVS